MNLDRLRSAESDFLHRYPGGFANEEIQRMVARRHNVGRLSEFARAELGRDAFSQPGRVLDAVGSIVARSSMVSRFEKPRFRDFVAGLHRSEREALVAAYKRLLHGNRERGFTELVEILAEGKLAKWSLVTIVPYQYRPESEVFVKPTTTKRVIRTFQLEGLEYAPRPSWAFYARYRDAVLEMKAQVDPSLGPNNAAFTGFLMMTMEGRL